MGIMYKKIASLTAIPFLIFSLSACANTGEETGEEIERPQVSNETPSEAPTSTTSKTAVTQGLLIMTKKELEKEGLADFVKNNPKAMEDYVSCIADKSYDSLSEETRQTIAQAANEDTTDARISKDDSTLLKKNMESCSDVLANSSMQ
ncbi:MAG: hypothetical protein IKZ87_04330 [Actinomycetaceae bacterium]|nr:hypothetical protein [Actinomycetaceae bacterium]